MNLAKKSTVFLVALSALALASCNNPKKPDEPTGPQEIGFLAARKWLKDAKTEEAQTKKIQSEKFEWDTTVTGTGMEPTTEANKLGGSQVILGALIAKEESSAAFMSLFPAAAAEVKSLKGSFDDNYKALKSKKAADDSMAFVDQDGITEIEKWENTYDHQHLFDEKSNLLDLVFGREEEFPIGEPAPVLNFTEEIIVTSDGYTDHWSISAENMPFKLKFPAFGVDADGTFSGTITGTFTYQTE